jgi:hypothetical protein
VSSYEPELETTPLIVSIRVVEDGITAERMPSIRKGRNRIKNARI